MMMTRFLPYPVHVWERLAPKGETGPWECQRCGAIEENLTLRQIEARCPGEPEVSNGDEFDRIVLGD